MFTVVVGGSQDFIDECRDVAKNVAVNIAGEASSIENTIALIREFTPNAVLIPGSWAKLASSLAEENMSIKIFISGGIEKSLRDKWDESGLPIFTISGKIYKAFLDLEAHLKFTSPVNFRPEEPKEQNTRVREQDKDTLTGCYTRRYLQDHCPKGLFTVVFIDLDNFKPVNDILGHETGDLVLAAFGKMLVENLKGQDTAVRWGGDEFVLILPETASGDAEAVVENLRAAWEKSAPCTGSLKVGFSAGVSSGMDDLQKALSEADRLMYSEKKVRKMREARRAQNVCGHEEILSLVGGNTWLGVKNGIIFALNIIMVIVAVSAVVWTADYAVNFVGGHSPYLHEAAKFVKWFWEILFISTTKK